MTIATPPPSSRQVIRHTPTRHVKPATITASIDPIRVLRRHVVAIVMSAVFGGVLGIVAYVAFLRVYPLYTGQVLFEVQPALQEAGQVATIEWTNDDMVYRIAQTETYMLKNREVLDQALKHPDIEKTQWYKQYVKSTSDGRQTFDNLEAVDDLMREIKAGAVRASNLFSMSWSTHNSADVPTILNAIANTYIDNRKARDRQVFDQNLNLFRTQSAGTERELQDLAQQTKQLIKSANLTNLTDVFHSAQSFRAQEVTRQLAEVSSALSVSQSNLGIVNEQLKGTLEPTSMDVYEAERDSAVMELIESIQFQSGALRRLRDTRPPGEPMLVKAEEQVRAYEAQKDAKVKEIIRRNLEARARQYANDVERFGSTARGLDKELDEMQTLLKDLAAEQSQYEALKTRREHLEAKRTADLQLINEVELMRLRADAQRIRLAQRALTPRDLSFPKPEIMFPLGILVVMGLTIGIVFLRELLDQRIKSASDLAVLPGAQILGSIPDLDDDPTRTPAAELVVRKHPNSVLAESYRQTMASLMPLLDRNGHQSLLVVGGLPGSGTTTVASNFAASVAATGRRALVIDANFRRPRLATAFGIDNDLPGLADILGNTAKLDQVIQNAEGISVISAGTPAQRISDRLNTTALDSMLAELRGRYDLVIFDSPPAVVSGDAFILSNKVDAAVLVVRANQEHRGLVARMIQRLADARCEMVGVVLNRPRGVAGGYLKKNYATMAEYTTSA
jgi:capsular exopolysaccharide synthesis family protein